MDTWSVDDIPSDHPPPLRYRGGTRRQTPRGRRIYGPSSTRSNLGLNVHKDTQESIVNKL